VLRTDEAYDMLISWVACQPFAQSARSSLASVDLKVPGGPKSHADDKASSNKKPLCYAPWNGRFYFWYKQHLLVFRRMQAQVEFGFTREEVSISCFHRRPSVLREFLNECRCHYLGLNQNKTSVFEHQGDKWRPSKSRDKRHISTVILNKEVKDGLVNDISEFLNPITRGWYSRHGIPYQRGYLLYGPPGTGKSSISFSIAGWFDLDIYILNIAGISDNRLKTLFSELPQHCVVLLEDVDAASSKRTEDTDTNLDQHGSSAAQTPVDSTASLSTLLNVLDGVGSPEGRVLIMTTNHVERLDGALIRPGRADRKIEFQLANKEMMTRLFTFVYDSKPETSIEGNDSVESSDKIENGKLVKDEELLKLAGEFAGKIPELEFSPAEIISLLLENKQSPQQAISNVDTWTEKIRDEKKRMKRADSWALHELS